MGKLLPKWSLANQNTMIPAYFSEVLLVISLFFSGLAPSCMPLPGDTVTAISGPSTNTNTTNYIDNNTTFTVTVSAGKYSLDNVQGKTLTLKRGYTYSFDAQDSSTSSHPLYLGTSSTGGGYSDEYTSGVTNSRTTNGILTIVIPQAAPNSLYYNCGLHSNMGAEISIVD